MDQDVLNEIENDAYASAVHYNLRVELKNRAMSSAERTAMHRAVQNALNLLCVQAQFAVVRDPTLVVVSCVRESSSIGGTIMLPETEQSNE